MNRWQDWVPPVNRDRSNAMCCDIASPLLQLRDSFASSSRRLSPAAFAAALKGIPGEAKRSEIFAYIPEEMCIAQAVLRHEMDHLRRQFSTPAGLLQWAGATCQLASFRELSQSLLDSGKKFLFPLLEAASHAVDRNALMAHTSTETIIHSLAGGGALETPVLKTMVLSSFLSALEGTRRPLKGSPGLAYAEAGLLLMNAWVDGGAYQLSAHKTAETESQWGMPWIGTKHLFEGFAIQEEASHMAALGCDSVPYTDLIYSSYDYQMLLAAWHRRFPKSLDILRSGNMRKEDHLMETWRILPVEAYAAADLALWLPFSPRGLVGTTTKPVLEWDDIQPGWRFSQALHWLEENDCQGTHMGADNREEVFTETQNRICDAMGWVRPESLAKDWLDYFSGEAWFQAGFFAGHPDEFQAGIARTVLNERILRPFDTVVNNISWGSWSELRFPLWMTIEKSLAHLHVVQEGPGAGSSKRTYLTFSAARRLLFGGSRGGIFDSYNTDLQREAIEVLGQELTGAGWDFERFRKEIYSHFEL